MTLNFGSFRSSWELGAQNTHIYDENRIFSVFRRESEAEFVTLCQNHKAANPRNRKSLQNPSGITYFYVFEVVGLNDLVWWVFSIEFIWFD